MRPFAVLTLTLSWVCMLSACSNDGDGAAQRADLYAAQRGDLAIRITEQGELQPSQSTRIKNEMEGQSTIIFLVEEGKFVDKGEKLVELDASSLLERKAQQAIALGKAEAALTGAYQELEIRKKELTAERLAGENEVRIAEIDLEKFLGKLLEDGERDMGEREQQMIEATANIELAKQEVTLAKGRLTWSQKLFEKGFITKDDLDQDKLAVQRQQKNERVAINQRDILMAFTHPKELILLNQKINEAETNLERIVARGNARITQAQADVEAAEKEFDLAKERDDNYARQINSAVIYAPSPGLVVYSSQQSHRGGQDTVEEGASVRERQTLIELPDVTHMVAHVKIHEAAIDKIRPGQRARIRVDSQSESEMLGIVRRVSPVADSGSRWSNNGLKVYKTEVEVQGSHPDLKPNMSASVTIIVAQLEDVIYVPLPAIRRKGSIPFVWLDTDSGPVAQPVEIGLNDFQYVEVRDGIAEGDMVYLATPLDAPKPDFPGLEEAISAKRAEREKAFAADAGVGGPDLVVDDGGRNIDAASRDQPGLRSGTGSATARFRELVEAKFPDLDTSAAGMRELFSNDEVRQAIEDDDELRAARAAMMEEMRGRFGRGGRGGRGGKNTK